MVTGDTLDLSYTYRSQPIVYYKIRLLRIVFVLLVL